MGQAPTFFGGRTTRHVHDRPCRRHHWQRRPLDPIYPVVFLDALMVKVRDNHVVHNKPAYLAVGIDTDGDKGSFGRDALSLVRCLVIWHGNLRFWQDAPVERETEDVLVAVGPRLRALRRERGITLAELAATTGVSESTLSRLESGQRRATRGST